MILVCLCLVVESIDAYSIHSILDYNSITLHR